MLDKTGKESHFVNGLRYTDEETMEVVQMVLAGKTNKDLVSLINQKGARAVVLAGWMRISLKLYLIRQKVQIRICGSNSKVDGSLILDVLDKGYIPVVASVGCDKEGHSYNINADTAAASIAAALHAENMILVSDIPGVLKIQMMKHR